MMSRKILYILLTALMTVTWAACSDDDTVGLGSQITVISADVVFTARESTGTVVVDATDCTVTSSQSWCTATVEGNTITVHVMGNASLEGRAARLTIRDGERVAYVTVQQKGFTFKYTGERYFGYNDAAREVYYDVDNVGEVTFDTPDWVTATLTENGVRAVLTENTTGTLRAGWLKMASGHLKDSIRIVQASWNEIASKSYYLKGYKPNGTIESLLVRFTQDSETGALHLLFPTRTYTSGSTNLPWQMNVEFEEEPLALKAHTGYVGNMDDTVTSEVYMVLYNSSDYVFTTPDDDFTMTAYFDYDEERGIIATFEDDGSWPEFPATGFLMEAYAIGTSYALGAYYQFFTPWMEEATDMDSK